MGSWNSFGLQAILLLSIDLAAAQSFSQDIFVTFDFLANRRVTSQPSFGNPTSPLHSPRLMCTSTACNILSSTESQGACCFLAIPRACASCHSSRMAVMTASLKIFGEKATSSQVLKLWLAKSKSHLWAHQNTRSTCTKLPFPHATNGRQGNSRNTSKGLSSQESLRRRAASTLPLSGRDTNHLHSNNCKSFRSCAKDEPLSGPKIVSGHCQVHLYSRGILFSVLLIDLQAKIRSTYHSIRRLPWKSVFSTVLLRPFEGLIQQISSRHTFHNMGAKLTIPKGVGLSWPKMDLFHKISFTSPWWACAWHQLQDGPNMRSPQDTCTPTNHHSPDFPVRAVSVTKRLKYT